mmetsp:Transcript_34495/g.82183  ORF Transcript_34495/g.82183 Transcript_34495/m.82183 type:complete len:200 (-) Transcript_34495:37-636(-)
MTTPSFVHHRCQKRVRLASILRVLRTGAFRAAAARLTGGCSRASDHARPASTAATTSWSQRPIAASAASRSVQPATARASCACATVHGSARLPSSSPASGPGSAGSPPKRTSSSSLSSIESSQREVEVAVMPSRHGTTCTWSSSTGGSYASQPGAAPDSIGRDHWPPHYIRLGRREESLLPQLSGHGCWWRRVLMGPHG